MKKTLYIFSFVLLSLIVITPVYAEIGTSSASPTPNMEDKIKLLVQENLSTTEAKLKEKVDLQSLVGFVGKITTISSGNLTIDSHGDLIQVTTNTKTAFLKDSSTIKITSLAIGDKIIVIGTSIKDDIVQAKRVTVIKDEPNLVKTSAIVAKIVKIDLKKRNLTLSINNTDQILTLSKKSNVKLEEYKAGQTIFGIIKEYNGALSISRAKSL